MNTAKCIGRVGALAVALGVGITLASTPAVAFAERAESGKSLSESPPSNPPSLSGATPANPTSPSLSTLTSDPPGGRSDSTSAEASP